MLHSKSFGQCQGPIWQVDDISECVRQDYFQLILPLSIVTISSLLLLLSVTLNHKVIFEKVNSPHKVISDGTTILAESNRGYHSLAQDSNNSEEYEDLIINDTRFVKEESATESYVAILDTPLGQRKVIILEIFAVLVLDILNIVKLNSRYDENFEKVTAIAGIITWTYIAAIVFSRLALIMTSRRLPGLWTHTVLLYSFLWLLSLVIFRSAIIHPRSKIAQATAVIEFFLTSLLFLVAITTRKGNKPVMMVWENNLEPSREQLSSLLSTATFSWVDAILWKGFKKTYELPEVWNLIPRDKAAVVLADFRQLKKTTALSWHLLRYFKWFLIIQCVFAVVSAIFTFAPTLLLKSILEFIENPDIAPRNVIWLYIILLAFTDILRSFAEGQALWIGRRICIRLRVIIVSEIYAKALRRKAASTKDTILGERSKKEKASKNSFLDKIFGSDKQDNKIDSESPISKVINDSEKPIDEQANDGTIINLMSVDSFNVSEITAYLHFLFAAAPFQLIIAVYLLYQILGLSSIPGLIVMVILLPVNIILARGFGFYQKKIMAATDKRIHVTNEVLQNIRIIKYFAWEQKFAMTVNEKRNTELKVLRSKYRLWAFAVAIWNTVPIIITFFSFLVYTTVEGKPLYPSIAFTAISLFNILRVPLDQLGDMIAHVLESKVSIDRIEEFLKEEETDKYNQLRHGNFDENGNKMIGFKNATFSWGIKEDDGAEATSSFHLFDLDIKFEVGGLNIVAGPTGSGKTSLLMALLGEMTLVKGKIFLPGGSSREDIRPDPETGLTETVAYCAQKAWLVNANIKDNILFAASYDKKRYHDVIFACALERDLQDLSNGDQTLVGEKGITLSGGQKQRISLARALYSNSKYLLLDDCLSAVDSHTAKWVFQNCIRGPLMQGRTCILVTHNLALCLPQSQYLVVLDNGKINFQGKPHDAIASGKLGKEITKVMTESLEDLRESSKIPSNLDDTNIEDTLNEELHMSKNLVPDSKICNAMNETKAEGGVKMSVVFMYLRSMGSWRFWVIAVFIFVLQQFGTLISNAWIRKWANQYGIESVNYLPLTNSINLKYNTRLILQKIQTYRIWPFYLSDSKELPHIANEVQGVNVAYYLMVYAAIGVSCMLIALLRDIWLFFGSITASSQIHQRLIQSIIRAKFKFFDITALGQIMNRFSKDLEAIDQEVAPNSIGMISCALEILLTIGLITYITPGFLVAAVFIGLMYYFVSIVYLKSSRDLKRLESIQRSPLFQHFGETLTGIITIRAFGDEKRFIRDNLLKLNSHNRPFFYLWATNRWLAIRMDIVGDFVAFAAGVLVILSIGKTDAGSAGLSLSYAISFTENVLWTVRLYATNEQNMNSVERIKEYLEVEQEAEAVINETKPAPSWPDHGCVEFINYSTKYRADLDPVLMNVSFKINPGEKVGIVGRTGAGKSSLALALFRGLEAEEGKIVIDDVDIGYIGLQDLRESITIVPQDPTLFSGTIRTNLDPFDHFSDEEIFDTLRRVQLIGDETSSTNSSTPHFSSHHETIGSSNRVFCESSQEVSTPISATANKNVFLNLSYPISESGSNLSQGQRQLLCLARAMLKNPKILVMDEATASIDYSTDAKIQKTIRELKSTIITIAHRLQTIMDYDKVLVLDHGRVVEFGHPWILLAEDSACVIDSDNKRDDLIKTGMFRNMCEMSDDMETLAKIAKKAWGVGFLVDLE